MKSDNRHRWFQSLLIAFLAVAAVPSVAGSGALSPALGRMAEEDPEGTRAVWIFFEPRETGGVKGDLADLQRVWCRRSLERRAKVTGGPLLDEHDLPVGRERVIRVAEAGARIRVHSRWLNAVSADVPPDRLLPIASLPLVREVRPVASYRKPRAIVEDTPKHVATEAMYGPSFDQVDQIQVPTLHEDYGLSGQGVRIGLLDTRFDRDHEALQHVRIFAEWDFVDNDPLASYEEGDPTGPGSGHGTQTLSTIAGYRWGALVGPAYAADYVVARTEVSGSEDRVEEDYWVAGLEWAESLGVDILSSSLGYIDWYSYEDMDGATAAVTRAADRAAAYGVLVVNSAGNEGDDPWLHVIAPADGDSVLAVGAVRSNGIRVDFSSVGPTYDGRVKPDVMAQGASNYAASATNSEGYQTVSGTSFSAPLVAGLSALLLEAHPEWTPMDVIRALRSTATRAHAPDNYYGWGICQGVAALQWSPALAAATPPEVRLVFPNPFRPGSTLMLGGLEPGSTALLKVYDCLGRLVARNEFVPGSSEWAWDGTDRGGEPVAPGVYFARVSGARPESAHKIVLVR